VFQDEHGDFPAGSYIRNPPQSSHTPSSAPGCVIFVKLWQFDMQDRTHNRVDTNKMRFIRQDPEIEVLPLFADEHEDVVLERWTPGAEIEFHAPTGAEILVLEGGFEEANEAFKTHSWLRLPKGSATMISVGGNGARVWIKRNHLAQTPQAPAV
jgi:anti-sigma factor ChrR (cupin superfamily)